jgi:hypothetical protein
VSNLEYAAPDCDQTGSGCEPSTASASRRDETEVIILD